MPSTGTWRAKFVARVYATHNESPRVRAALARLLAGLPPSGRLLNVGSGRTSFGGRACNLDRYATETTTCVGDAHQLPFPAGQFDRVISQETVEHLEDPFAAVREMARVLRAGGRLYLQAPFVIGYHPGPEDYWRFTGPGLRRLVLSAGLECESVEMTVAGGTGYYRILVEFCAALAARLFPRTYRAAKGAAALVFFPLKWLDGWLSQGPQRDRIAGGYFVLATKPR